MRDDAFLLKTIINHCNSIKGCVAHFGIDEEDLQDNA
jgi:hypothetical protein